MQSIAVYRGVGVRHVQHVRLQAWAMDDGRDDRDMRVYARLRCVEEGRMKLKVEGCWR